MNLYLQFGYGMMDLSRELLARGVSQTVILSPRDLEPQQIVNLSADLRDIGGSVLVDPQFYLPRADHHRLTSHEYWPDDYDTTGFSRGGREEMLRALLRLNQAIGTSAFIVPGERAASVSDDWTASQSEFRAAAFDITDRPTLSTLSLAADLVRSNDQVAQLMEYLESEPSPGYYLVCEHPDDAYLVPDPQWLANTLDIAATLKLAGAQVVVGYANHQQLIMACVAVDGIASGNWMNVRCFLPDKFRSDYEEEVKRRTTWYYLPQALSEYTLAYLDIAFRQGLAHIMEPLPPTPYAAPLFATSQPTASGWGEPDAFRHYLSALSQQANRAVARSFDETVSLHANALDLADGLLATLRQSGVRGRPREFQDALDANRAALHILQNDHGARLRREWPRLIESTP